jgi:hypothetical protein
MREEKEERGVEGTEVSLAERG